MNEKDLLIDFATNKDMKDGRQSCFMENLTNARNLCGYDLATDTVNHGAAITSDNKPIFTTSFSGLTMYLIALEMMGKIFEHKLKTSDADNGIKRAGDFFPSCLTEPEKLALVALRNALIHSTGLVNIPKHGRKDKQPKIDKRNDEERHKFSLDYTANKGDVIEFPKTKWDGKYGNKADDQSTTVRVIQLIRTIEAIYRCLVDDLKNGHLELNLDEGIEELKAKYTVLT